MTWWWALLGDEDGLLRTAWWERLDENDLMMRTTSWWGRLDDENDLMMRTTWWWERLADENDLLLMRTIYLSTLNWADKEFFLIFLYIASLHDTRSTINIVRNYKNVNWIETLIHSSQLFNHNSSKELWNILKQRVKRQRCSNMTKLKRVILREWDKSRRVFLNFFDLFQIDRFSRSSRNSKWIRLDFAKYANRDQYVIRWLTQIKSRRAVF